ncbi:DUF2971 domain-containing protein [Sessilibacter sp. MAH1]
MITKISQQLYAQIPEDTLYHYTSLTGLMGIVESKMLRASDIRYMNDSTELKHLLVLLSDEINIRLNAGSAFAQLLNQFSQWLSHRIVDGPMLFGASFRANGNLLSQWRGYSTHGKGVSLGFNPKYVLDCAAYHDFSVGKCIYNPEEQKQIARQIVNSVENTAKSNHADYVQAAIPDFTPIFEYIEGDLLKIAAILKHPSFEEEQEWRVVSPIFTQSNQAPIYFRESLSMLVPYYAFDFTRNNPEHTLQLQHVFVGPTSNSELSMKSVALYLQRQGCSPTEKISYCRIPYRQK